MKASTRVLTTAPFPCGALLLAGALLALGGGCSTARGPQLGRLYSASARNLEAERNPVIVIPGILGSRLVDAESRRIVWGAFGGDFADPATPEGARLAALPMGGGMPVEEIRDGVVPDGALDRVDISLWGINFRLSAYYNILKALGVGGYRDEDLGRKGEVDYGEGHFTCFQFDYDWRLDLAANARRLGEFIAEKHAYVQGEIERRFGVADAEVRFDIVAHSMGGLLARYFLRYGGGGLPEDGSMPEVTWAGALHVERLIMVGTPNAGSVEALEQLVGGFGGIPFVPRYEAALLGTFPSLYQLLPPSGTGSVVLGGEGEGETLDVFDPSLWERMGWGLADPRQRDVLALLLPAVSEEEERRRIALEHQRGCLERAARLVEALAVPASPPPGLSLVLFAGDAEETDAVVSVDPATGRLTVARRELGDGTVLRSSALMDRRVGGEWSSKLVSPIDWDQVFFFFKDHLGITRDPVFTDNLLYLILEEPDRD